MTLLSLISSCCFLTINLSFWMLVSPNPSFMPSLCVAWGNISQSKPGPDVYTPLTWIWWLQKSDKKRLRVQTSTLSIYIPTLKLWSKWDQQIRIWTKDWQSASPNLKKPVSRNRFTLHGRWREEWTDGPKLIHLVPPMIPLGWPPSHFLGPRSISTVLNLFIRVYEKYVFYCVIFD